MNNINIIIQAAIEQGIYSPAEVEQFISNGQGLPLRTFAEWRRNGYNVRRGENAILKIRLWQMKKKKKSDENNNEEEKADFYLLPAHLFSADQVVPIEKKGDKNDDWWNEAKY